MIHLTLLLLVRKYNDCSFICACVCECEVPCSLNTSNYDLTTESKTKYPLHVYLKNLYSIIIWLRAYTPFNNT